MSAQFKLRLKNATQIAVVCDNGEKMLIGKQMNEIKVLNNATVIVNNDGKIHDVGDAKELEERYKDATFEKDIDVNGYCIVPGLVDGHTHPVWSGDRVHEFALKLSGATYMEIHEQGGGIGFTVNHTKQSDEDELLQLLHGRLNRMLKFGTTLVEAKSGYGLETETEMKMLKVLTKASKESVMDIVITFLGAHSIPKGSTEEEATNDIINNQIAELIALRNKKEIIVDNVDVFLEKGVFSSSSTRRILTAGKEAGLEMNFHGDEIHPMQAGELAGQLNALAVSHLERVSEEGMKAMAKRPSFAVLLPTTAYILRLEPPPARKLIQHNVPVALGTDFNPNAHCLSMPFTMNLACVLLRLSPSEALAAATINSAGSLKRSDTHGSIEKGKWADMVLLKASRWEHIIYDFVDPPIQCVFKAGSVVSGAI